MLQTNVTIQSATLINNFQVQVSGTITCDAPGSFFVGVQVLQQGPMRELRSGSGGISQTCSSGPDTWIVTVTGERACDPTCSFDSEQRTMRLRR